MLTSLALYAMRTRPDARSRYLDSNLLTGGPFGLDELVHALFEQAPERYADREGGYTRVLKDGFRKGDNSEMGIIELV